MDENILRISKEILFSAREKILAGDETNLVFLGLERTIILKFPQYGLFNDKNGNGFIFFASKEEEPFLGLGLFENFDPVFFMAIDKQGIQLIYAMKNLGTYYNGKKFQITEEVGEYGYFTCPSDENYDILLYIQKNHKFWHSEFSSTKSALLRVLFSKIDLCFFSNGEDFELELIGLLIKEAGGVFEKFGRAKIFYFAGKNDKILPEIRQRIEFRSL